MDGIVLWMRYPLLGTWNGGGVALKGLTVRSYRHKASRGVEILWVKACTEDQRSVHETSSASEDFRTRWSLLLGET